jgi:hypothetical protein
LCSYAIDAVANNRLKFKRTGSQNISFASTASILPFAQDDMVRTFVEGINPQHLRQWSDSLSGVFNQYAARVTEEIAAAGLLEAARTDELRGNLLNVGNQLLSDLMTEMMSYRQRTHVTPIVNAVAVLPKDELAAMAESLVNLTSFKRRISMEVETVGGPVDVAVISKGDGFVWIKRKHYFKAELNPYFFENYFRTD